MKLLVWSCLFIVALALSNTFSPSIEGAAAVAQLQDDSIIYGQAKALPAVIRCLPFLLLVPICKELIKIKL